MGFYGRKTVGRPTDCNFGFWRILAVMDFERWTRGVAYVALLDASSHMRTCPSVRPLVGPPVCWLLGNTFAFCFRIVNPSVSRSVCYNG